MNGFVLNNKKNLDRIYRIIRILFFRLSGPWAYVPEGKKPEIAIAFGEVGVITALYQGL